LSELPSPLETTTGGTETIWPMLAVTVNVLMLKSNPGAAAWTLNENGGDWPPSGFTNIAEYVPPTVRAALIWHPKEFIIEMAEPESVLTTPVGFVKNTERPGSK